ncbi:MAG TPA: formylglycine-generating enzyme family protein [Opitutales bacterium]|nr:formylglycine-generating enzyme family protein [Opitutales bacterium]
MTAAQEAMMQGKVADLVSQFTVATGIKLVPIPAGTFLMGSPVDEAGRQPNEGPQTRVTLTKGFFLGATAVTQAQWKALMGSQRYGSHNMGDSLPVDNMPWDEAMAFCRKLTEHEQAAGRLPPGYVYTLPTEAQWEYACRAGTTGAYPGDLDAMAWYVKNSDSGGQKYIYTMHPVGTKQPNAWGLYDMNGNSGSWCLDWFGDYPGGSVTDPSGPASGSRHVVRGGGPFSDAAGCRSASRFSLGLVLEPPAHGWAVGLRLALVHTSAN